MQIPGVISLIAALACAFALTPRDTIDDAPVISDYKFRSSHRNYLILPVTEESPDDETVIVNTYNDLVFISHDFGARWKLVEELVGTTTIVNSENDNNKVIALVGTTPNAQVFISWDRGQTFTELNVPMAPSLRYLPFSHLVVDHPAHPDWLIYHGEECDGNVCSRTAFYSKDKGNTWTTLFTDCDACYWVAEKDPGSLLVPELVYCEYYNVIKGGLQVFWSKDYFSTKAEIDSMDHLTQIVQDDKFIIGAYGKDLRNRELAVSTDGVHFNRARYPPSLFRSTYGGINIMENKDALLIFESESPSNDYGTLLRSDSEGYEMVSMLEKVSRPRYKGGYVDFDRLRSVEGVMVANVVSNEKEVNKGGDAKLKTVITHSDGANWASLVGPEGGELHLHGYTDRITYNKQPSTPSAIGIFLGRGNEGDHLTHIFQSNTYMTRDAGLTWFKIAERPMIWSIGDSGAVIVLADFHFTDKISYSLDEGATWHDYSWGYPVYVSTLDSIPSGAGRKFMLLVMPRGAESTTAIHLDFSTASPRVCTEADFEPWQPEHPQLQTKCLLGREVEYKRRIRDRNCIVGKYFEENSQTPGALRTVKNCVCAREDYECDYTHQLDPSDNQCKPIANVNIPTMEDQCVNGAISWKKLTGYRKLAASSCEGDFLEASMSYACPGKEEEFKNGLGNGGGELGPGDGPISDGPGGSPDGPSNSPNGPNGPGGLPFRADNGRGFFGYIFYFIKNLFIIAFAGALAFAVVYFGWPLLRKYKNVHLPDGEDSFDNVHNLWHLVKSYIPFVGSQVPHDHLGFYSRMDDDERYRILEEASEDEFFQDEEESIGGEPSLDPNERYSDSDASAPTESTAAGADPGPGDTAPSRI